MKRNLITRLIALFTLVLFLSFTGLSTGLISANYHSASQIEAQQAIDAAQATIFEAFGYITQADLAGADITDLVSNLNTAIRELNMARAAFYVSDFPQTILNAETAQSAAEMVIEEAQSLTIVALTNSITQVLLIVAIVVIIIIITYLLFTRWRKHQQQRTRRLLEMEISLPREEE